MKWKRWIGAAFLTAFALVIFVVVFQREIVRAFSSPTAKWDQNTIHNLKNAISAYFTEYREFPVQIPDLDTTVETRGQLMNVLLGSKTELGENGRNPRGIAFYTDRGA